MTDKLIGCPFCGSSPRFTSETDVADDFDHSFSVFCEQCGISITDEYKSGVIENWNRRAETWRPISEADKGIAYIHDLGEMKIGNSYPIWVRDEDGRVYEALWSDNGKKAYWWDIEGESPVDPVEFMPHPLAARLPSPPSEGTE